MPYKTAAELPDAVKALPSHARRIWMSAFNAASKQYDKEEQVFRIAWSAIQKAGYRKKGDKWVRIKESDDEELTAVEQAWIDGAVAAMLPDESEPITEQAYTNETDPRTQYMDECYREAIYSAMNLLSRRELGLDEPERDALTAMVSRLVKRLGAGESMGEAAPTEAINLDAMQEAVESLLIEADLQEAGQRHRNEDYPLFDQVLELVKKLRGQSPQEIQAEQQRQAEEAAAKDPTTQMLDGYHAGATAVAMTESAPADAFRESIEILREASTDGTGREWQVRIIQAGTSKNGRTYPLSVLQQAAPLFEGAKVYTYDRLLRGKEIFDHLTEEEVRANPRGYAKDLVGYIKDPHLEGSSLMGTLVLFKSGQWLGENLKDAMQRGLAVPYELSIDASGNAHDAMAGGQPVKHVDAINYVRSVDVVTHGAAGGGFVRLVASYHPETTEPDTSLMTLVESLREQMARMSGEMAMSDLLDEHAVNGPAKKDVMALTRRLLAGEGPSRP